MRKALTVFKKLLSSDHFLYLGFKSLAAVVNLVSIGLFVAWFGLETYGASALIVASSTLLLSIVGQWMINAVSRYFYEFQENFFRTLWSYGLLILLMTVVIIPLGLSAGERMVNFTLVINLFVLTFCYNFSLEFIRMKRQVFVYGISILIEAVASVATGYILSQRDTGVINPVYLCIAVSMYLPLLFHLLMIRPNLSRATVTQGRMKEIFHFGYPMSISSLFGQVIFFGARYFLGLFFGLKEVGIFSTLYDISQRGATFILNTLTGASQVIIFKEYGMHNLEKVNKYLNKQINLILQFSVIVALLFFNAYPYIMQVAGKSGLEDYKFMLVFVSIIVSINRIKSGTFDLILQLEKNTLGITRSTLLGAVISVVPGILIVKYYGIWGAVCSMLLSYCVSLFYSYVLVRRMRIAYFNLNASVIKKNLGVYALVALVLLASLLSFFRFESQAGNIMLLFFVVISALFSIYTNSTWYTRGGKESV